MAGAAKISALTELLSATANDVLAIVDTDATETKKITVSNLLSGAGGGSPGGSEGDVQLNISSAFGVVSGFRVNGTTSDLEVPATVDGVDIGTDVPLNTTHRTSDGTDHSDVVLNNTHRSSAGTDHSDVVLNNTHRSSAGTDHSDVVLNNTHRSSDGSDHSFLNQSVTTAASPTFQGLTINDYVMPTADGTVDQVATTDGAGQVTFQDLSAEMPALSVYDNAGGQTLTTTDTTINFDTTKTDTSSGLFTLLNDEITVNEDALCLITIEVTADNAASTRSSLEARLQLNTGGGFTDVDGGLFRAYNRTTTNGGTASLTIVLDLNEDDILRVVAQASAANACTTVADASRFNIIHLTGERGPKGETGSGSTITVKSDGTSIPNTPHSELDFANGLNASDAGSGVATIELGLDINAQTGTTYTLVDDDHGKLVTLDNASAITLDVDTGLRSDFQCVLLQKGAGQVTIGGTATVNNADSFNVTEKQWCFVNLIHLGSDVYVSDGRLVP